MPRYKDDVEVNDTERDCDAPCRRQPLAMARHDQVENRDNWPEVKVPCAAHEVLVLAVAVADITVQLDLLGERERMRGRRLQTALLQHHYLAAHTALRQVLGWQLQTDPARMNFAIDVRGKPSLPAHHLAFNLSHSGAHALIALTNDGSIGVDLEGGERLSEVDELAERVFAASELTYFQTLVASERRQYFLTTWTRKEAVLKALGVGLPGGMDQVVIADHPLRLKGDLQALPGLAGLHLVDLPKLSECTAALCYGPQQRTVRCSRWPVVAT